MSIPASPGSSLPPVSDWAIRTLSSSGEPPSSNSAVLEMPTRRRMPLETALSRWMNGLKAVVKSCSGRAMKRATGSALLIA